MKAREQKEFAKRWTGMVSVVSGDTYAQFTSLKTTGKENKPVPFPNDKMSLKIKLADLPKEAKRVIKANIPTNKPKEFRIRLNEDGDEVETVTPARGVFPNCKLVGLGPKDKDGNWRPMLHKVYHEGEKNENSHDEFIAIYEMTEGPFAGVELPGYYLHYKFEEVPEGDEDEGMTQFNTADTPQASQLHKLQAWADVHGGILDEPIEWPDDGDIRPEMEERALAADVPVTLVFEKGYIDTVQPTETYDEEETEEEFDEKFPDIEEVQETIPSVAKHKVQSEVVEVPAKSKSKGKAKKAAKPVEDDGDDL